MYGNFRSVSVVLFITLAASGCGGLGTDAVRPAKSSGPAELSQFYGQEVKWGACPADEVPKDVDVKFECAGMQVPLDYANPGGETITVALNRIPAQKPKQRIGSLATNPGGPGESGLALVYGAPKVFTAELLARYDIVGMDPRGVGRSDPVQCLTADEATRLEDESNDPVAQARTFSDGCKRKSGKLLPHAGTDNTARDLDVLRAALKEEKLNYLGFSYGTVLGQFYANQFPQQTGRFVLDSVANPSTWPGDPSVQAVAFETALRVFVKNCTSREDCPMGRDRTKAIKQIDNLFDKVAKEPLKTGSDSPPITSEVLLQSLSQAMYAEETWTELEDALTAAFKGNGKPLHEYASPGSDDAEAEAGVGGSFEAIYCPHIPPEQRTLKAVKDDSEEAEDDAPVFGAPIVELRLKCAVWPTKSLPQAGRAITANGAPPILLVHNRHDAATPVEWARAVDGQLAESVLVTNAAGGHGFYPKGPCTKKIVDNYLINGELPAKGTTCNDHGSTSN